MKRYIILIIVITILLTSCTSIEIKNPNNNDNGESFRDEGDNQVDKTEKEEIAQSPEDNSNEKAETTDKLLEMENEMIDLVNKEREKNGLNKLEIDEELRNVARIKSEDIAENDYFDHISPRYGSPFEMMESFNIDFVQAAENLAGHQSVKEAHQGLMNSKSHRENILSPGLTHIGIGIKEDDKYLYIFTQMFISKDR